MGTLVMGEDRPTAIDYFNRAIKSDPKFAEPYFHSALLLEKEGEAESAATHYRRFLDLSPAVDSKLKGQIEMRILKLKALNRE